MIKAKLIVVGGDAKRTEVSLKQLPVTIGRAKDASITLPHSLVSRKHCELFEENNKLCVRDLNSLNGTYLNNERITESKSILPGQLLTLGNVTFRASYSIESDDPVEASYQGKDYPEGHVNPAEPEPRFWTDVDDYRPYFDQWKTRWEYASRLAPAKKKKTKKSAK